MQINKLLFIFFLLLCQAWLTRGSGPPRLNVSDEYVVNALKNMTEQKIYFSLRCEGSQQIFWNWTTTEEYSHIDIADSFHQGTDEPFVSTLTVKDSLLEDTGYYYCHYADVGDWRTDKDKVASTYVYIYDGINAFVEPLEYVIQRTTSQTLLIPCRTTLPDLSVTLTKGGNDVTNRAVYNAREGFLLHNLILQDSGTYTCSAAPPYHDSQLFVVQIIRESMNLSQPNIDKEPSQHFVMGLSFRLKCTLLRDDTVVFHWTLPNSKRVPNQVPSNINQYQASTLTVDNASLADTGNYICTVSASGHLPNSYSFYVSIMETLKPYINITSQVNIINRTVGEQVDWKASVLAYPKDPILIYRNWTGREVEESSRVTTEHNATMAESWLRLRNLSSLDHGTYVLEGSTRDQQQKDSVSYRVQVLGKPTPWLEKVPEYVRPGHNVTVSCVARGFPRPDTKWLFKACSNSTQICTSDFQQLQVGRPSVTLPKPGNIKNVTMTFTPQSSGSLRCDVNNSYGTESATQPLPISDIDGLFVLLHTGENDIMEVSEDFKSVEVVVDDTFHLLCAAAKFNYAGVSLTFSGSGPNVVVGKSEWSWQHVVEGKVMEGHKGTYTCTATPHDGGSPVVKILKVTVKPQEEVIFKDDANMKPNGYTMIVKEQTSFSLNCTVTGTPPPSVTWFKDNEELKPSNPFFNNDTIFLRDGGQRLVMKYVFREGNVGMYKCLARNRVNKLVGYLNLDVHKAGLSSGAKAGLGVAIVGIILLVLMVVWLIRRVKTERKFRKSFRRNELYLFEKGNVGQLNPDCTADEQAELLPYGQEWEVSRQDIRIGKQLGSGAFGRVVKALVTGLEENEPATTVAIKMCKSAADPSQVRTLALELKIMIHLGKHLNIVNLMGASTINIGKGELWILVEYCRFGNLQYFLHRHRRHFINQIDPRTGKIDVLRNMHPGSPPSADSQGSSGYRPTPITDKDGYLAPSSTKFTLANPPKGRSSPTPTSTTLEDSSTEAGQGQVLDNPLYMNSNDNNATEDKTGEDSAPSVSSPISTHPNPAVSPIVIHPLLTPSSSAAPRPPSYGSDASSSQGYRRSDGVLLNTDMTTLQSPAVTGSLSPPPFSPPPFSPFDSSGQNVPAVDSQGIPYYQEVGSIPGVTAPFTTSDLICWAWQVAQGMDYLSSRKVLHGDLAARNLLLADNNVIKISDFGLSRDMYKKDVYTKKNADDLMPIKWMSVEAIRDRIFSIQSDVWAYGVTLWELFSLGSVPYPGIEVNKDFLTLLEEGYKMDRPKYANEEIYDLLLRCWAGDPRLRPTFKQATEALGTLMLPDLRGEYMTMNDPYLRMNEERFQNETDYLNMLASPHFDNLTQGEAPRAEEVVAGGANYVNIMPSGGSPDSNKHYMRMSSPSTRSSQSHYLLMQSPSPAPASAPHGSPSPAPTPAPRGSTSPMTVVFSPRPAEPSRFSFEHQSDNTPRLPEVAEEEEGCTSPNHINEKSNLINGGAKDASGSPASPSPVTSPPPLQSDSEDGSGRRDSEEGGVEIGSSNGEVAYMNLSRTDS